MTRTEADPLPSPAARGGRSGAPAAAGRPGGVQLLLFPIPERLEAEALRRYLERGIGARVNLVLTRNRTSVLTFKREADGGYEIRLQRVFLEAPDEVLNAVVSFVRRPTRPMRERVVAFFSSHPDAERRARRPSVPPAECRTAGQFHDLAEILDGLNGRYFGGALESAITWGGGGRRAGGACGEDADGVAGRPASGRHGRRSGRAIRFGSYLADHDLIRIHPALDADWVPRFFVESIVYHEMLHAVVPVACDGQARRLIHPPEFKRREREFHARAEAVEWERVNLRRLLAARG